MALLPSGAWPPAHPPLQAIDEVSHAEQEGEHTDHPDEQHHNGLLSGPRHITVYHAGAWGMHAGESRWDQESKQQVMQGTKSCLRQSPKKEVDNVARGEIWHGQVTALPIGWWAASSPRSQVRGVVAAGTTIWLAGCTHGEFSSFVQHIDTENSRREQNRHTLDQPEAQGRHRGEEVIANVGASRLQSVAYKPLLLVLVDGGSCQDDHCHPQQDREGEPELPHNGHAVV